MSWVVVAVTVVSTVYTAKTQREAGKQEKYDLERQAEKETLSSEGEEIKRFQANIMMQLEATQDEVQEAVDEIIMSSF